MNTRSIVALKEIGDDMNSNTINEATVGDGNMLRDVLKTSGPVYSP